ncbi:MAG: SPASM domain-containing protein, partial [Acidobacteriota bacterium]
CCLGLEEPVSPVCNAPWTSAVVEADGAVKPCFFHPPIGYLKAGYGLREVLNGPAALAFRAGLNIAENPVFRQCVCSLHWRSASASAGAGALQNPRDGAQQDTEVETR